MQTANWYSAQEGRYVVSMRQTRQGVWIELMDTQQRIIHELPTKGKLPEMITLFEAQLGTLTPFVRAN